MAKGSKRLASTCPRHVGLSGENGKCWSLTRHDRRSHSSIPNLSNPLRPVAKRSNRDMFSLANKLETGSWGMIATELQRRTGCEELTPPPEMPAPEDRMSIQDPGRLAASRSSLQALGRMRAGMFWERPAAAPSSKTWRTKHSRRWQDERRCPFEFLLNSFEFQRFEGRGPWIRCRVPQIAGGACF